VKEPQGGHGGPLASLTWAGGLKRLSRLSAADTKPRRRAPDKGRFSVNCLVLQREAVGGVTFLCEQCWKGSSGGVGVSRLSVECWALALSQCRLLVGAGGGVGFLVPQQASVLLTLLWVPWLLLFPPLPFLSRAQKVSGDDSELGTSW
jgi:hypothetical protein